jgi:plastocyanin
MLRWILRRWSVRPLVSLVALAFAASAWAGQIRVDVGGPGGAMVFTPSSVSASVGDHVVWIWIGGTHTVTSGDFNSVIDVSAGDGLFNSGPAGIAGANFSYKVTVSGTRPYYCIPHLPDMLGTLNLSASGATGLSDFRITEVQFNAPGNLDLIEITNLGAAGNLGRYRLKVSGPSATQTLQITGSTNIAVPAGGRVVLHCNQAGTNTTTNLFLPAVTDLPANGSLALYVPSTLAAQNALTRADMMIDFVQWGAGGQENEATAQTAGLWSAGAALTSVADGHSIEFCGNSDEYGFTQWAEISTPNFGSNGNCLTPAIETTWGRLKTIYH